MNNINIVIFLLLASFACGSIEEQEYKNLNKTYSVSKRNVAGEFSKVKYIDDKFVALNQFSFNGQSLYIINENGNVWQKELIKPNTTTITGGIPEDIFLFQDYFILVKDIGMFIKYNYAGEEIEKISMRHIYPEKNKCQTIYLDKNGSCYFACYSLMQRNPKEFKILKGNFGSDDFLEIYNGKTNDNVNKLAFHIMNKELYILMPYSNNIGVLNLDNQEYKIEEFRKSNKRKYIKPKEFIGSGFEFSKLSKLERAEYKEDIHLQIYIDRDSRNIVSHLNSLENKNSYLVQGMKLNGSDYFDLYLKYPVSFDDQGHVIGYIIEEDDYKFFIKHFINGFEKTIYYNKE